MKARFGIYCICVIAAVLNAIASASPASAAVTPRKMFVVSNGFSNAAGDVAGNPRDSLMFYDVTSIGSPGASNVFANNPTFSIWMGNEILTGTVGDLPGGAPVGDREEISAITFNPVNGTIYVGSFDSGSPGTLDSVGDNIGDMDIYKIDYQSVLKDYITNSRPRGTIYAPKFQRITTSNEEFLRDMPGGPSYLFDGTVDGIGNNVPHPTAIGSTVIMDTSWFTKIGEVGRPQSPIQFFDVELDFVDPATMAFLDSPTTTITPAGDPLGDYQIRAWQRVSTSPGAAPGIDADGPDNATGPPGNPTTYDDAPGGANGNSTQSWKSSIMGRPQMDANITDVGGWAYVKRDGKMGVWVADNELGNTGDQVSYFELDFSGATPTATKKPLPTATPASVAFRVDENPSTDATTNNGEIDQLYIDKNGNLVVVESGFFDTVAGDMTPPTGSGGLKAEQPRVLTVGVESYNNAAGVVPTGFTASGGTTTFDSTSPWTASASINPATTDDTNVINTTRAAYDRSTGYLYVIDQDADFAEDMYIFDPGTGTIVYHEINGINPSLFNTGTQEVFTRGDATGDGVITYADVKAMKRAIADPTLGGTVTAALGAEWYDMTGDGALTSADLTELVNNTFGTRLGDFNLDGAVDGADKTAFNAQFGSTLDGTDFLDFQQNFGFVSAPASAVPEPATALLILAGAAAFPLRRRCAA